MREDSRVQHAVPSCSRLCMSKHIGGCRGRREGASVCSVGIQWASLSRNGWVGGGRLRVSVLSEWEDREFVLRMSCTLFFDTRAVKPG